MNKRQWRRHRPIFTRPAVQKNDKQKLKWRILPIIWMAIKRMCMVIGAMVLISALFSVISASYIVQKSAPKLPSKAVLYMNIEGPLAETPRPPSFSNPFSGNEPTLHDVIYALDIGAHDPRVKGLLVRMSGGGMQLAQIEELRAAVKNFRASGKFAYVYSSSYAENGGFGGYYLASAFEQIWMQPMGAVSIPGLNAQLPFFRSALEKLGVTPQFFKRKEYKSAYEALTNDTISPENKEMMEALIKDFRTVLVNDISADRNIDPARFESLVDQGLFTAETAQQNGLTDVTDYADVLAGNLKENILGDRESKDDLFVPVKNYMTHLPPGGARSPQNTPYATQKQNADVALIHAIGTIIPSNINAAAPQAMFDSTIAAANVIAPAIIEAADSETIKTIVLRIDSPGGSPTASESILRALSRAKEKGKTVIVSMGGSAASGGYWIAANADKIYAMPTTITGSIGVLGGKVSLNNMWDKLGINWAKIQWGENSGLWSVNSEFSESEAAAFNAMLDQIYDGFIDRVAEGRKMDKAAVEKIAKGRVWSGAAAQKIGLVDELGSLNDALDYAATLQGKENRYALNVITLPKPKSPFEEFLELLGQGSGTIQSLSGIQVMIRDGLEPMAAYAPFLKNNQTPMVFDPVEIK